ncbi:hypothetical protein ONZ45_g6041 [Pleurotus djamor]|nr:hypothetical protein ONZ45_g6041 [Pleurotus djamor]
MPAPAVYILAAVGTVAASLAFYEFVYEPHIAPKLEQWAEEFIARRKARRAERQGLIAIPQNPRSSTGASKKGPGSSDNESDDDDNWDQKRNNRRSSIELEHLVAKELSEWRSEIGTSALRHRKTASSSKQMSTLDESNISIPYAAIAPTHVIFNSEPSTPTSTIGSGFGRQITHQNSQSTLRSELRAESASPNMIAQQPASPEMRSFGPGPWVAQQRDIALSQRFENFFISNDTDNISETSFSRSMSPISSASSTSPVHELPPMVPVVSQELSPNSSRAPSPMYQTALSPLSSPIPPQINVMNSGPPSPASPSFFSPTIPSLSFTARGTSSDEGDLVSRPTSSMSFLSDAHTAISAPSELSFSPSDNFDDLEDDILSIGSGSDFGSPRNSA